jgi:hypothetical protein
MSYIDNWNRYIDNWNRFEWWEKVAVVPGIIVVGIMVIMLSPVILLVWISTLVCRFLGKDEDLFY